MWMLTIRCRVECPECGSIDVRESVTRGGIMCNKCDEIFQAKAILVTSSGGTGLPLH